METHVQYLRVDICNTYSSKLQRPKLSFSGQVSQSLKTPTATTTLSTAFLTSREGLDVHDIKSRVTVLVRELRGSNVGVKGPSHQK